MRFVVVASILVVFGCEKSPPSSGTEQGAPSGLPQGEMPAATHPTPTPTPTPSDDPHAGLGMDNPHGGGDPHAGMDMGGTSPVPTNVDPNMVLEGSIAVSPKLKDQVKPGDILFLSVKSVDEAGTPQRIPIAADRQDAATFPMPFKLTGANTMMQGTKFEGDVLLTVRVDRDGEAMSRKPGDIEGSVRAKIPARGLKIVLDTPVR
jgi:hypothetical protein